MNLSLAWIYFFNIVINTFLSFFTAAFLTWLFLKILRIKSPRVLAVCLCLPLFKIGFDLFRYRFFSWALSHEINPVTAEKGTRTLTIVADPCIGIQLHMQNGKTFSVADTAALSIDPLWIYTTVLIAGAGTLAACILRFIQIRRERKIISSKIQESHPIVDLDISLETWLWHKKIRCLACPSITVPCIFKRTILIPASLIKILSAAQLQAVIAHEAAHFQGKDYWFKYAAVWISSIFWWIPMKWWLKKIENQQEHAADNMIYRFGISKFALADSIFKTARACKPEPALLSFSFFKQGTLKSRIKKILQEPVAKTGKMQRALLALLLILIFFGRLWIF